MTSKEAKEVKSASSSSFQERYYRIGPPLKMSDRIFQQKPLGPEIFISKQVFATVLIS